MLDTTISGPVIGVDEAGRGPVLGPLVVAGVLARGQDPLRQLGVRDSKQLTPDRRQELAVIIREICNVEVVVVSAQEIDTMRKTMTLNEIEVHAFSQVLRNLLLTNSSSMKEEIPTIILDAADVKEERFGQDIERKLRTSIGSVPRIISKHKADDIFPVVSAASIIAKTHRDDVIGGLKLTHGEIGSGYPSDPRTKNYLETLFKNGEPIPPFVRQSWETVVKLKTRASSTRLEDFF